MGEKKDPKKRAEKYEAKVAVKGTFEDMIAASLKPRTENPDAVNKNKGTS